MREEREEGEKRKGGKRSCIFGGECHALPCHREPGIVCGGEEGEGENTVPGCWGCKEPQGKVNEWGVKTYASSMMYAGKVRRTP